MPVDSLQKQEGRDAEGRFKRGSSENPAYRRPGGAQPGDRGGRIRCEDRQYGAAIRGRATIEFCEGLDGRTVCLVPFTAQRVRRLLAMTDLDHKLSGLASLSPREFAATLAAGNDERSLR